VLLAFVEGLLIVRTFMLFHDYVHGAILRDSWLAGVLLKGFGFFVFTPPQNWRQSHNYHHAHTAQIVGSHVGSFALLTTGLWPTVTPAQRLAYRITRHPVTIALGIFTLFIWGMTLSPFLRDRKKHMEALGSFALHGVLALGIIHFLGVTAWLFAIVGPLALACALGGYMFYAQHNFPGMHIEPRQTWEYARAALESSSYMKTGPVMRWFTGNIGYHHVHHLNPSIPFYRLPEAMAAMPELQHPGTTSLWPRDVLACLRLKLWDKEAGHMVGYPKQSQS
jgi:omega-6 fatty acid desaturase (delta-12 desaturase)